jgi:metal-responsive CopG/Arc/MetJ family transcriptional regulator
MRFAVSISGPLFRKLNQLARRSGRSRSELFRTALGEYVERHWLPDLTEAMDRVCTEVGDQRDAFVSDAGRQVLENTEW